MIYHVETFSLVHRLFIPHLVTRIGLCVITRFYCCVAWPDPTMRDVCFLFDFYFGLVPGHKLLRNLVLLDLLHEYMVLNIFLACEHVGDVFTFVSMFL